MGHVLLGGLFEPGTSVSLHSAPVGVSRATGHSQVGRRVADENGSVGFDGLADGARFIAAGFNVHGVPHEVVCRAQAAGERNEISQPPVRPDLNPQVGTQEERPAVAPVGAPDAVLHTGVPESVASAA